jgi:hypothetical protein
MLPIAPAITGPLASRSLQRPGRTPSGRDPVGRTTPECSQGMQAALLGSGSALQVTNGCPPNRGLNDMTALLGLRTQVVSFAVRHRPGHSRADVAGSAYQFGCRIGRNPEELTDRCLINSVCKLNSPNSWQRRRLYSRTTSFSQSGRFNTSLGLLPSGGPMMPSLYIMSKMRAARP